MDNHQLLPIGRTLSVMLTHKCNAECAHCGTLSSPRAGGRADLDSVFAAIDQAAENGFLNVVFTGGEPTIYFDDLLRSIRHAKQKGLSTRVVTNAGWCKTPALASFRLRRLIEAGLDEINLSTGDEHQRFVPLERVVTAAVCALDQGIPVHLMIEKVRLRHVTKALILDQEPLRSHPLIARLGVNESPWMPLDPFSAAQYEADETASRGNIHHFPGCDSVLQTYVLHPDGGMTTCCGIGARTIPELAAEHGFDKERHDSLASLITEAEEDFLKLWMRQEGPEKILCWAASHDPDIAWENIYAHRCQACARIYADPRVRRVIFEHHADAIADVLAKSCFVENVSHSPIPAWVTEVSADSGSAGRPPGPRGRSL